MKMPNPFYCEVPADCNIQNGKEFTITGHKALQNGKVITNCKPGEETVFTATLAIPNTCEHNHKQ